MRPSAVHHAPNIVRRRCHDGCGADVDSFRDDINLIRQLDIEPVPIDLNLSQDEYRARLWEWRGPRVGWVRRFIPSRSHHPLRLEHECRYTPERRRMRPHGGEYADE